MNISLIHRVAAISLSLLITVQNIAAAQNPGSKPNIILIMSDDMGYSDLGSYGGEINTPNLDRLANRGLRFTQFYNAARCCPTRASLLTGLYPHQTGIGHMTNPSENQKAHDYNLPGYRGFLNENCVTLAEVLRASGYATLMTGKWHVGKQDRTQWPLQRGFDKYYGILDGATNYFKPSGPRGITLNNDSVSIDDPDYYSTDAFTDQAIHFIHQSTNEDKNKPFFLYLAYNAPHWPLQAPKADIDKYRTRYDNGWEAIRQERFEKMKSLHLIDATGNLPENNLPSWNSLSEEKQNEMALRRAIYAAQVDRMDQNIGKLVSYLERENMMDNTIILFINDNGACAEGGTLGGGRPQKLETREGYFLSYGEAWAAASNTPLRSYKHWTHEGGISSPLIVYWPAGIPKKIVGGIVRQYAFLQDIMATFVELAEGKYPETFNNKSIPPMEGESLVPLFKGRHGAIHNKPIFWEHEGNKAVRLGRYKLVMKWKNVSENKWELYDIERDRMELNDLSKELSSKVDEMSKMWQQWADSHHVVPWDDILKITQRP